MSQPLYISKLIAIRQAILFLVLRWFQEGPEKANNLPEATQVSEFQTPFHETALQVHRCALGQNHIWGKKGSGYEEVRA